MAVSRCPYEDVVAVFADKYGGITISVREARCPPGGEIVWIDNDVSISFDDVAGVIDALQDVFSEIRDDER